MSISFLSSDTNLHDFLLRLISVDAPLYHHHWYKHRRLIRRFCRLCLWTFYHNQLHLILTFYNSQLIPLERNARLKSDAVLILTVINKQPTCNMWTREVCASVWWLIHKRLSFVLNQTKNFRLRTSFLHPRFTRHHQSPSPSSSSSSPACNSTFRTRPNSRVDVLRWCQPQGVPLGSGVGGQ